MIDISTQAPVATASEGAAAMTGQFGATASRGGNDGAAGFLHLFEILLGGMPQGGKIGSVAGLVPDADASSAAMPAEGASLAALLSTATGGEVAGATDLLPSAEPEGVGAQDAQTIAGLLQLLGFSVEASDVASLGELDRQQLDAAMEFVQRGLETGASANEILENAACLMPREWNWNGEVVGTVPRNPSLATGDEGESEIDPARMLVASEAVRQILAPSMAAKGTDAVENAGAADDSAPVAIGVSEGDAARPSADMRSRDADVFSDKSAFDVRKGITIRREVLAEPAGTPVSASSQAPTADAVPGRESKAAAISSSGIRGATEEPRSSRLSSPDAFAVSAWGAKASTESVANATPAISQGVKAGSMASEFIGRQVLEKVDVQLKQGRRELNVRLWPEELGEVRLSLRVGEADKLDARILVQTESVRQAILDATPQLREALSRHGMEMGRLSVNIGSDMAGGGDASGGERRRSSEDGAGRFQGGSGWREETVEYGAALALGVDSGFRDGRNTLDMWS